MPQIPRELVEGMLITADAYLTASEYGQKMLDDPSTLATADQKHAELLEEAKANDFVVDGQFLFGAILNGSACYAMALALLGKVAACGTKEEALDEVGHYAASVLYMSRQHLVLLLTMMDEEGRKE